MTIEIAEKEPTIIKAGTTVEWKRVDQTVNFPASTWALEYHAVSGDPETPKIKITADQNGSTEQFLVSVAPATSRLWKPGCYKWGAYVSYGGKTYQIGEGEWEIQADLATVDAGSFDPRTINEQIYDAITNVLLNRASQYDLSISLPDGRSISKMSLSELRQERDIARQAVLAERKTGGGKIVTRFVEPQ